MVPVGVMSPRCGPYIGLAAAVIAAAPLGAFGALDTEEDIIMVAICTSDGAVRMMPLSLDPEDEPAPAPSHSPIGCHAPCLVERRDGPDAVRRLGPTNV